MDFLVLVWRRQVSLRRLEENYFYWALGVRRNLWLGETHEPFWLLVLGLWRAEGASLARNTQGVATIAVRHLSESSATVEVKTSCSTKNSTCHFIPP